MVKPTYLFIQMPGEVLRDTPPIDSKTHVPVY